MLSKKTRLAATIAALSISGMALAEKQNFSQTYFFGDSLQDTGFFRSALPALVPADRGRFTTNPGGVSSDYLAAHYGTSSDSVYTHANGTSYAAGGAGTDFDGGQGSPSLDKQVDNYLNKTGGVADSHALYSVWAGSTDLLQLAKGTDPEYLISTGVSHQVNDIQKLHAAGARYILVPNLPDIGVSPNFRYAGLTEIATKSSAEYNSRLYDSLNKAGVSYIPVDTRGQLQEIMNDPKVFGIRNTSDPACGAYTVFAFACGPEWYVTPDAAKSYMWADWFHATSGVNEVTADAIISELEAPRLQEAMLRSARNTGHNRADQVARHVTNSDFQGLLLWGNLSAQHQGNGQDLGYGGDTTPSGLIGLDYKTGNWIFGGFGGYGYLTSDLPDHQGDFREKDTTLGAFAGWYGANLWGNLQLSYTWLNYEMHRKMDLGPTTRAYSGNPNGDNITLSAQGGYSWHLVNNISHGPIAAVTWQKIQKDGYSEHYAPNTQSTALGYKDEDGDSLIGRLGWQVSWKTTWVEPYAELSYEHEFKDENKYASARLQTIPIAGYYRVPGLKEQSDNYGNAVLGARLSKAGIDADLGVSSLFNSDDVQNTALFLSLSKKL